jgi:hypothetical protein
VYFHEVIKPEIDRSPENFPPIHQKKSSPDRPGDLPPRLKLKGRDCNLTELCYIQTVETYIRVFTMRMRDFIMHANNTISL